jgi:hypothetical protein
MQFIEEMVPTGNITVHSLVFLAKVFGSIAGITFHRDFTRRRALIIKWFDDHIEELLPIREIVTVCTESLRDIDVKPEE